MNLIIVAGLVILIVWGLQAAYKAGRREADAEHSREEEAEVKTPNWSTHVGKVKEVREEIRYMVSFCVIDISSGPGAISSAQRLRRALADTFPDGTVLGRSIVYTVSVGMEPLLEGFTRAEDWGGPPIPPEGIQEKGYTTLQPLHRNQFLGGSLRQELEGQKGYENVRFY